MSNFVEAFKEGVVGFLLYRKCRMCMATATDIEFESNKYSNTLISNKYIFLFLQFHATDFISRTHESHLDQLALIEYSTTHYDVNNASRLLKI